MCGARYQEITRMGVAVLPRLKENSDLVPTCAGLAGLGEGLREEQCHLPALSSLERAVLTSDPPTLALILVNLVSLHMSLALFKLLHLCWRPQRLSLLVSVNLCLVPLRPAAPWSPAALHLSWM